MPGDTGLGLSLAPIPFSHLHGLLEHFQFSLSVCPGHTATHRRKTDLAGPAQHAKTSCSTAPLEDLMLFPFPASPLTTSELVPSWGLSIWLWCKQHGQDLGARCTQQHVGEAFLC